MRDSRQCSSCHCSKFPWIEVHMFQFIGCSWHKVVTHYIERCQRCYPAACRHLSCLTLFISHPRSPAWSKASRSNLQQLSGTEMSICNMNCSLLLVKFPCLYRYLITKINYQVHGLLKLPYPPSICWVVSIAEVWHWTILVFGLVEKKMCASCNSGVDFRPRDLVQF